MTRRKAGFSSTSLPNWERRYKQQECPPSFAKNAKEGWGNRCLSLIGKDGPAAPRLLDALVVGRYRGFFPASPGITTPSRSSSQAMADIFHSPSFRTN